MQHVKQRARLSPTSRRTVLAGFLLVTLMTLGVNQASATGQVGEPAADFTLQDSNPGNWHTLSDYQGEVVVLFMMGYA